MIETFPKDSSFITTDTRTSRWAIPYHHEALNSRVENLVVKQKHAIEGKKILDLGCHFGTFAYACLVHGAEFVHGVDTEGPLVNKAEKLFAEHGITQNRFRFTLDDLVSAMNGLPDDSYDTVICLGVLYYIPDLYGALELMKKKARQYIMVDTFTAYYGACMTKEGVKFYQHLTEDAFSLPIVLHPLTQAEKKDYTLTTFFKNKKNKPIGMLSLPTIPALENYFRLLDLDYKKISWAEYRGNRFTWKDFANGEIKKKSHWSDVYHADLRVSYLLTI